MLEMVIEASFPIVFGLGMMLLFVIKEYDIKTRIIKNKFSRKKIDNESC